MIICLTTSKEAMAIVKKLQSERLAEHAVYEILYVTHPEPDKHDRYRCDRVFFENLPIDYSFRYAFNRSPKYQTSESDAGENIAWTENRYFEMPHIGDYSGCMVEFCTTMDLWSVEAKKLNLGRRILKTLLSFPECTVQILTRNAALAEDFDVIEQYKDRVYVGMYIPATPDKSDIISIIEPQSSRIEQRMEVLKEAHRRAFYTSCSFYPIFHGISDSPGQIDGLIQFANEINALEIIIEPVDHRDPLVVSAMRALMDKGLETEAAFVGRIGQLNNRSRYVVNLVSNIRRSFKRYYDRHEYLIWRKLHIMLWSSGITEYDIEQIKKDDEYSSDIIWFDEPPAYFSGWINYASL